MKTEEIRFQIIPVREGAYLAHYTFDSLEEAKAHRDTYDRQKLNSLKIMAVRKPNPDEVRQYLNKLKEESPKIVIDGDDELSIEAWKTWYEQSKILVPVEAEQ